MTNIIRVIRRTINRLRGVPLVLACLAAACSSQAPAPTADACMAQAEVCVAACPANAAPIYTQHDSCLASCNGTLAACEQGAVDAPTCELQPRAAVDAPQWAVYACPAGVLPAGETCADAGGGTVVCDRPGTGSVLGPVVCVRVDSAPHACDSNGCWATLACDRNPAEQMGLSCTSDAVGVFACKW